MASTTYSHLGDVTEMYAAHGRFRDLRFNLPFSHIKPTDFIRLRL